MTNKPPSEAREYLKKAWPLMVMFTAVSALAAAFTFNRHSLADPNGQPQPPESPTQKMENQVLQSMGIKPEDKVDFDTFIKELEKAEQKETKPKAIAAQPR